MPIPQTRQELVDQIETEFGKLDRELRGLDSQTAERICVDDWSVKDLLAVRLWWTRSVLNWIEQGRQGKVPATPAKNYRWNETPRLNQGIVSKARGRSYRAIVADLRKQYRRLLSTIDTLSDKELLAVGTFEWAGGYPISRWLSINTARQYRTACSYIRKVGRE